MKDLSDFLGCRREVWYRKVSSVTLIDVNNVMLYWQPERLNIPSNPCPVSLPPLWMTIHVGCDFLCTSAPGYNTCQKLTSIASRGVYVATYSVTGRNNSSKLMGAYSFPPLPTDHDVAIVCGGDERFDTLSILDYLVEVTPAGSLADFILFIQDTSLPAHCYTEINAMCEVSPPSQPVTTPPGCKRVTAYFEWEVTTWSNNFTTGQSSRQRNTLVAPTLGGLGQELSLQELADFYETWVLNTPFIHDVDIDGPNSLRTTWGPYVLGGYSSYETQGQVGREGIILHSLKFCVAGFCEVPGPNGTTIPVPYVTCANIPAPSVNASEDDPNPPEYLCELNTVTVTYRLPKPASIIADVFSAGEFETASVSFPPVCVSSPRGLERTMLSLLNNSIDVGTFATVSVTRGGPCAC